MGFLLLRQYTAKRILLMIPTLLGAGVLIFFLMRVIPGDICLARWVDYGTDLDPALLELCRDRLGLNEPLHIQFWHFMRGVLSFDFGVSMWTGRPIIEELELRFALSLQLAVMATVVTLLIAVPLGIVAALRQNTWVDYLVRTVAIAGVAMPSFWLGILIILGLLILSQAWLGEPWMPPIYYVSPFENFWGNMSQLIWPALVAGYRYAAVVTRMTRSALLEVLREDYIRTARTRGLTEKIILNRHALRNSFLPVITIIGIEFSFFMGGLVVTEQVFNLNGLGRLLVDSVLYADYNMIQALVMIVVAVSVLVNLLVDLSYAWLDPRIRYS
ncbi:MAG: ABC transporter permease [Arenicellales bacterium]|nr:ABC transporter permease [Arenicellales bacterium]